MSNAPLETIPKEASSARQEYFVRMTLHERFQHWILILSFGILVLTGLPLVVYDWKPVQLLLFLNFSFQLRGILHRIGAAMLIGLCLWHLIYVIFTARGRETVLALMPKMKDLTDAFDLLMHNLGFTSWLFRKGILIDLFRRHPDWLFLEPPRYARYNFIEKFEYLGVVWGSAVMIVTGFFMWQVELAMRLFPRYIFEVFVTIHSFEAILALLAILIWHMYSVHFAPEVFPMSKVWLTGRISKEQMMREHPLEYEKAVGKHQLASAASASGNENIYD